MKILFITSSRLGDAVLSTGLLGWLIDRHEDARITVVCGPLSRDLFEAFPRVERVISLRKRGLNLHWLQTWARTVLNRWDLVVDLRNSPASLALFSKRRMAKGRSTNARSAQKPHKLEEIARIAGGITPPPVSRLYVPDTVRRDVAARFGITGPVLAIAPTANWIGKTWPPERFAETIHRLAGPEGPLAGIQVAVLGGPGEEAQAAAVLEAIPPDFRIDLVGKTTSLEAAAILSRARLFIGNDSGLMHMAAALKVPTIGLFGPSLVEVYAPVGDHCRTVRTDKDMVQLVREIPDYDSRTVGSLMGSITVDKVVDAAMALLAETSRSGTKGAV